MYYEFLNVYLPSFDYIAKLPHNSPSLLHGLRNNMCLLTSVCHTGSAEEPQHGNVPSDHTDTSNWKSITSFCVTTNGRLVVRSSSQIQRASFNANGYVQDRSHSSSGQRNRSQRRSRHHQGQKLLLQPPQSAIQKILNPGNLLRRLLPSSSLLNPATHPF